MSGRNPNSKSSAFSGKSFSLTQNGLCVIVLLSPQATAVTIQSGKKFGYALPLNTEYQNFENWKRVEVTECPLHANHDCIMKRINEMKSFKKCFP